METPRQEASFSIKRILKLVIVAVTIGLVTNITLLFVINDENTFSFLRSLHIFHFIVPFLCILMLYCVNTIRLKIVFTQYRAKLSLKQAFKNSLLGNFFDNITPFAAGGQPFQIYHLQSIGADSKTSANVILSRFVENAAVTVLVLILSLGRIIRMVKSLKIGDSLVYIGLTSTFIYTIIFLLVLIRPDFVGKIALKIENSFVGRIAHRLSKKHDWASKVYKWSRELKEDVRFLWKEKLHIMIIDTLLGILIILIHSFSLYYSLRAITGADIELFEVFITFIIVWQVVFYIPTPGASGSVEAGFTLVFAGLTGLPKLTQTAILLWRFSTYYIFIGIGFVVFLYYIKNKPKHKLLEK